MEMQNELFDFESLAEERTGKQPPLTGLTVGVYHTMVTLSPEMLEAMGRPAAVSVEYSSRLSALVFRPDPAGPYTISSDRRHRITNSGLLAKKLAQVIGFDRERQYCRLTDGKKRPGGVCFWLENRDLIDRTIKRSRK